MFFRASYETMNWDLVKSFFNYSILYIYVNAIKSSFVSVSIAQLVSCMFFCLTFNAGHVKINQQRFELDLTEARAGLKPIKWMGLSND